MAPQFWLRRIPIACGAIGCVLAFSGGVVAQTVQLPTTRIFSGGGSVLVPDQGSANLGGISRSASGSSTRGYGPVRSRSGSTTREASGISVSAYVIDFEAMERELLGEDGEAGSLATDDPQTLKAKAKADAIKNGSVRSGSGSSKAASGGLESVSHLKALAREEEAAHQAEIAETFAKAEAAIAEKKWGVARVHYKSLIRNEKGEVAKLAKQLLTEMEKQESDAKLSAATAASKNVGDAKPKRGREF